MGVLDWVRVRHGGCQGSGFHLLDLTLEQQALLARNSQAGDMPPARPTHRVDQRKRSLTPGLRPVDGTAETTVPTEGNS